VFREPLRSGDIRKKKGVWMQEKSDVATAQQFSKRKRHGEIRFFLR